MADTGLTVIGAGVVGLAVAARLARDTPDLVILERHERHGLETSSRNSEVIHAGIYYAAGSLKARFCVEGNRRVYELCARHGIPHRAFGKIISAVKEEEMPALQALLERGRANGAPVEPLTAAEVARFEPNVRTVGGIWSPSSGVVSAHGLMDYYLHTAREAGAVLQPRAEVVGLERVSDGYRLTVGSGAERESFTSERVVNAAGLDSDRVAGLAGIDVEAAGYRLHYCKGSYFSVSAAKSGVVSRLVYPVPNPVSLGVHALVDFAGRLRFGPDAEYLPDRRQDYRVAESKRPAFAEAVRRLVPAIDEEDLQPDISGIRPKLQGPRDPVRDFVIAEESARGLPGLVNLIGIESPGLTCAPTIADHVAELVR